MFENAHALVVGVSKEFVHKDEVFPEISAAVDARLVKESLECVGYRDVKLLLDDEATARNINIAVRRAEDLARRKGQLILLYFACHGDLRWDHPHGTHLLAWDAKLGDEYENTVRIEDLARIPGNPLVVLLDVCHSGKHHDFHEEARRQFEKGEQAMWGRGGRAYIAATPLLRQAYESPIDKHGLFTLRLVEALCDVRRSTTESVSVQEIAAYLEKTVPLDAERLSLPRQQPFASIVPAPSGDPMIVGRGVRELVASRLGESESLPEPIRRRSRQLLGTG